MYDRQACRESGSGFQLNSLQKSSDDDDDNRHNPYSSWACKLMLLLKASPGRRLHNRRQMKATVLSGGHVVCTLCVVSADTIGSVSASVCIYFVVKGQLTD